MVKQINLVLLILLTGCASRLETLTPSTNFLTSEVQGEQFKTTLSFGFVEGQSAYQDVDEETTEIDFATGKSFAQAMLMPQMGLFRRIDVFAKATTHSPFMYGIKWQVFGHTKKEAKIGRKSFSLYMSGGRQGYSSPGDSNLPSSGDYTADRIHTMIDMGAIYGKRLYSDILLYGRFSRIVQSNDGEIDYEDNSSIDEQEFELDGDHDSYGLGIVWYTPKINLGFEANILQTRWDQAPNKETFSIQMSLSREIN